MTVALDEPPAASAIIVYDGDCALCARSIQFVAARDPDAQFRFTASGTAPGRALLAYHGLHHPGGPGTMVFIEHGRAHVQSTAALRIARRLPWPWRMAAIGLAVPRPVRDAVYRLIARHRYRWFGRRDACDLPSPEVRARLL